MLLKSLSAEQAELLSRVDNGPAFIREILGSSLWDKQVEIARAVDRSKRVTVRSCQGSGKSYVAARIVLRFIHTTPDSIVLTTAPTFRQVENIIWREIRAAQSNSPYPLDGELGMTQLNIRDKWFALGVSTDRPEQWQGFHAEHILLVVDEAAGVSEANFVAMESILASAGSRLLLLGNPTSLAGTFYDSHRNPGYSKIHISAFHTPNFTTFGITLEDIKSGEWRRKITGPYPMPQLITPEWVVEKLADWGEDSPMFQARVLGEFPEQGADTLIPLNKIEAAALRDVEPEGRKVIAADIARYGSSKTWFMCRQGGKVLGSEKHGMKDTMETVGLLCDFQDRFENAVAVVDEIGIGAGVFDRMREKGRSAVGVNVGLPAYERERFRNLRAELYWKMREKFMDDDISIPNDPELIAQLANIKQHYTSRGIEIESKDEAIKRGVRSPDGADALALTFVPLSEGGIEASKGEDREGRDRPITGGLRETVF